MPALLPADVPTSLPPGSRLPRSVQTVALLRRQVPWLRRQRARHGSAFTIGTLGFRSLVVLSDPELIKRTFTADPRALHAGEGSPLGPVLGPHSLLTVDEDVHLRQRKLLLPPFHGQRMRSYEALIEQEAIREIDAWPVGVPFATAPSMQRITLRAILRAVFGARGAELAALEDLMPAFVTEGSMLAQLHFLQRDLGPRSPWGRFLRRREAIDRQLDEVIAQARRDPGLEERADVLALLVQATAEDGSPMTDAEIRGELVTLLAAGHETTAHALSWAVERLSRSPEPLARLVAEIDAGEGSAYRDAAIQEVLRIRPVLTFAARLVKEPFALGEWVLPVGSRVGLCAALTHDDPRLFSDPRAFRPERFLERKPETYAWIPFGGGVRRCIGAAFAHMEMDVVLRTMLARVELQPTSEPGERMAFRGVTHAPSLGGLVTVRRRLPVGSDAPLASEPVPA